MISGETVMDNQEIKKYGNAEEYELLSLKDARQILGVGANTMYDLINTGQIPYIKGLNGKKIRRGALYKFIMDHETTATKASNT